MASDSSQNHEHGCHEDMRLSSDDRLFEIRFLLMSLRVVWEDFLLWFSDTSGQTENVNLRDEIHSTYTNAHTTKMHYLRRKSLANVCIIGLIANYEKKSTRYSNMEWITRKLWRGLGFHHSPIHLKLSRYFFLWPPSVQCWMHQLATQASHAACPRQRAGSLFPPP